MNSQAGVSPPDHAHVDQDQLAGLVGLPSAWIPWLVQIGDAPRPLATEPTPRWLSLDVDHWARRVAAARMPGLNLQAQIPLEHLRLVALRMLPLHESTIATRVGLTLSVVRRQLRGAMFTLLRTVEPEIVTAWQDTTSGDRVVLARRSRVSATLVRLILDGFPSVHPHAITPAHATRIEDLWRAGAPWDLITDLTKVTARAASRPESGLTLQPERWSPAQVGSFLGWSSGRIYQRPRDLPPPDGSDGDRVWWWSTTIKTWAEGLDACPTCGGRFQFVGRHAHWHARNG